MDTTIITAPSIKGMTTIVRSLGEYTLYGFCGELLAGARALSDRPGDVDYHCAQVRSLLALGDDGDVAQIDNARYRAVEALIAAERAVPPDGMSSLLSRLRAFLDRDSFAPDAGYAQGFVVEGPERTWLRMGAAANWTPDYREAYSFGSISAAWSAAPSDLIAIDPY